MAEPEAQPQFLIQVEPEVAGARLEFGGRGVIEGSKEKLEAAAALAEEAAKKLGGLFTGVGPDSGSVEFALTFEGEAGMPVLAKGKFGASITVTLNWGK